MTKNFGSTRRISGLVVWRLFLPPGVRLTTENTEITEFLSAHSVFSVVSLTLSCLQRATTNKTGARKSSAQFRCGKQP